MNLLKAQQEEYDIFIHNVIYLRKQHHLSKKEMAQICEISVYALNRIEKGSFPSNITVDIFFNIQYHFGISPCDQLTHRLE